jgi:hypothetical protein
MAVGGPCVIFAPVVFVLMVLALPLWPVAIILLGLLWCLVWPVERILRAIGLNAKSEWSNHVAYWLVVAIKPKYFFDPVNVRAKRRAQFGITPRQDADKPQDPTDA